MIKKITLVLFSLIIANTNISSQNIQFYSIKKFKPLLPKSISDIEFIDLDNDGDPDVMKYITIDGVHIQWIDDDDDMKITDVEGDTDSDCLMIDRNKDGLYGAWNDLIIDFNDEDKDGKADLVGYYDYSDKDDKGLWQAHYWWFIDYDKDGIYNYVDWNSLALEGWKISKTSKFYPDYNGNSTFLKIHTNTFNIEDLRYNWENPFHFYDFDNDGLSEMVIRYIDEPILLKNIDTNIETRSVKLTGKIKDVRISVDIDNDSNPDNELDFDLSLRFIGDGFDYSDQVQKFKSLKGIAEANKFFIDDRIRKLDELIFTSREKAYPFIFTRGKWDQVWFTFDEDDDCNRWERVELYEPKDPYLIGEHNGGIDNNPQADPAGDRGEWDLDFSGKGQLYISSIDNKIHLYGAEKGAWRIDYDAKYFQNWGGWRGGNNLQPTIKHLTNPENAPLVLYHDKNNDGYFDYIEFDFNGDKVIDENYSFDTIKIKNNLIAIDKFIYSDFKKMFVDLANKNWKDAIEYLKFAKSIGINTNWDAYFLESKSIWEKYNNSYWLKFYLFQDLKNYALLKNDKEQLKKIIHKYFTN
ncbi:MAG: hypothetical protein N2321_10030 [Melioribacteraceae bacterium]|nr:hypothetical protein [Melioribacteraceae bacterium]